MSRLLNDPLIIRINARGQPLKLELGVQVLSFSYEDSEKEDDLLNVVFSDPYHQLVDSDQFQESTEWSVQWGFPSKLWKPRKVLVKRPKFRYGEVEVQCLDKGSKLKVEERWETKKETSALEIIEAIAARHQLTPQVTGVDRDLPFFLHGGMTDFEVLKYLESRFDNHYFKISSDKLIFEPRNLNQAPLATFNYRPGADSRLLSFEISIKEQDNGKSSGETSSVSIDPYTFKTKINRSNESQTPMSNLGQRRVTDSLGQSFASTLNPNSQKSSGGTFSNSIQGNTTGKVLVLPPSEDPELKAIAEGKRRKSVLDNVEAEFEIMASPSDPYLESGSLIEIQGIGQKFSGSYQIVSINHELTDGYKYKINAKRNAVGSSKAGLKSLNGVFNQKSFKATSLDTVSKSILGSNSGTIYG